jgi:hypothetical protein
MDQRFIKSILSFFILRNNLIKSRANALGGLVKEAASMFSVNAGPKTSEHAEISLKAYRSVVTSDSQALRAA